MHPVLTLNTLRRLAGPQSFDRGEQYFTRGLVRSLSEYEGTIMAKVKGTHMYTVRFRQDNGTLKHSCTCPMGDEDIFCKHCVAVGLAWLETGNSGKGTIKRRGAQAEVTMKDVKGHFESLDKDALIDMIMQRLGILPEGYIDEKISFSRHGVGFCT